MIINFYDVEEQPIYCTVIATECAFFKQVDINTQVGILPIGATYEIIDFMDITEDELSWAKIKVQDSEYYVILTADKYIIDEAPVVETEAQKDGIIKSILNKILK